MVATSTPCNSLEQLVLSSTAAVPLGSSTHEKLWMAWSISDTVRVVRVVLYLAISTAKRRAVVVVASSSLLLVVCVCSW